ncbi:hypothetical protein MVLG_03088 [Microbotryum lychnidis-dioicae p1A1 Lamole]|uniref:Uncharacterized protein n=1 Tax=Microbotryum lychnidis-dioicae (strain p1A1 Lamole / MvSl-1064) TaxID=683840 RepID=U5H749_USTV1|nr:hypothetical protein MVLG_03088 [Microbotryum lychnidis-dioicae p1A1 Lamole]|eukprot:KDE06592.1 hypothetical protein MVLG_03088 [Microbotryum lychnidis-dioicae p1A1 Lamole]
MFSATDTTAYKIYLSNTPNAYREWSIWVSNNLRLDDLLDVTTLGIPAVLEIRKAGLLTPPATSQPSTSGGGEDTSTSAPAAPTLSAKDAEKLRLHALVLKSKDAKAWRLIKNYLHRNQMAIIKNCTSAFAMWQALYIHHSTRFMQLVPVIFRSTFSRPGNFRSFVLNSTNAVEESLSLPTSNISLHFMLKSTGD